MRKTLEVFGCVGCANGFTIDTTDGTATSQVEILDELEPGLPRTFVSDDADPSSITFGTSESHWNSACREDCIWKDSLGTLSELATDQQITLTVYRG